MFWKDPSGASVENGLDRRGLGRSLRRRKRLLTTPGEMMRARTAVRDVPEVGPQGMVAGGRTVGLEGWRIAGVSGGDIDATY